MGWFSSSLCKRDLRMRLVPALVALSTMSAGWICAGQNEEHFPAVGQGCLLYKSPIAGRFEPLPLIHTDAKMDVRGLVASATVMQQYANSSDAPIEAVYIFPLPHDAAVYDLEIRIGNRVIRSVIHEREQAKRVYEAAKAEGKRAALLEQERPNIFTASVANIMPNDQISVRVRYVQPLKWEDGRVRLVFPMVVGPRYIPGTQAIDHAGSGWAADTNAVPDASRITPLVRNPENRPGHDISVSVDLDTGFEAAAVESVSHEVNVRRFEDGRQHAELVGGTTLPNKDFVLEIRQAESTQPKTALFLSSGGDSGETHFLLTAFPPTLQPSQRMPVEMLYMIDVSGSMQGTSIEQARAALLQALDRLRPNDRFGILQFNNGYREFAQWPMAASAQNVASAREYVRRLQAGGGTEMLPALRHLMAKPEIPGYLRHIILLTDGDLGNEEEIFAAMRRDLGGARLYAVAVGSAPNLFLAAKMAQFGRGTSTHVADSNEIEEQMTQLFEKIESPVLTDLNVSFDGVQVTDMFPPRLPDLFAGQPVVIYGRIAKGRVGTAHLSGRAGDEIFQSSVAFDTGKATFHPGITTLWARQKVEELMDRWRESNEEQQGEIRSSVITHAIRYRLVTRFTSLLAVEEKIVNPGGQSNAVSVATELPAGWKLEPVLGAPATGTTDAFFETLGLLLLCASALLFWIARMGAAS
jgi:Ca-activated chloride channel family protein